MTCILNRFSSMSSTLEEEERLHNGITCIPRWGSGVFHEENQLWPSRCRIASHRAILDNDHLIASSELGPCRTAIFWNCLVPPTSRAPIDRYVSSSFSEADLFRPCVECWFCQVFPDEEEVRKFCQRILSSLLERRSFRMLCFDETLFGEKGPSEKQRREMSQLCISSFVKEKFVFALSQ